MKSHQELSGAPPHIGSGSTAGTAGDVDLGTRFRQTLRMLRMQSKGNFRRRSETDGLPLPRPGESVVDYCVRAGLARSPQDAAAGLARALDLDPLLDELAALAADHPGADAPHPPRPSAGCGGSHPVTAFPTPTTASANGHGG